MIYIIVGLLTYVFTTDTQLVFDVLFYLSLFMSTILLLLLLFFMFGSQLFKSASVVINSTLGLASIMAIILHPSIFYYFSNHWQEGFNNTNVALIIGYFGLLLLKIK